MSWNSRGWVINGSNFTSAPAGPAINAPPVADPQSVSVLEDGYIAITLTATDPEGSPLTYAVLSGPTNGVLTGTAPNLTYTPTANYFGPDSFTFQADDGYLTSNIATISITVISVNDAPTADPQSVTVDQDGYLVITLTGSDPEGNPLTYSVTSGPSDGYLTGTAPVLTYFPDSGYVGPDSFTFTVNDGYVDSAPATVSIDVQSVFPVATLAADFTVSATIPSELTFARASAATYYDSTGTLQYAASGAPRFTHDAYTLAPQGLMMERQATNDALNSADFTGWLTYNASVTQNTAETLAPDGTSTAVKITEVPAGSGDMHAISPTTGTMSFGAWTLNQVHTSSFYAKAGPGRDVVTLRSVNREADGGRFIAADFNLTTGLVTFGHGFNGSGVQGLYDAGMERCANGWWRCWLTAYPNSGAAMDTNLELMRIALSPPSGFTRFGGIARYTGASDVGIYVWGMQVERGAIRVSSYIPTTSSAATRAADSLDVASTTGWYNDSDWTVIHDARYQQTVEALYQSQAVDRATTDQWRQYGTGPGFGARLGCIAYARELGLFASLIFERTVFGGTAPGGPAWTSSDGMNWTERSTPQTARPASIVWSPEVGLFVAVATSGSNRVITSPDGITWTGRASANEALAWESVVWSPQLGIFVAVASTAGTSSAMTSADGINWTLQTTPSETWQEVTWAPELGLFVAVGSGSTANGVMTSPDGINWTAQASATARQWFGVAWSPQLNLFAATANSGSGNRVMTSPDGITWTSRATPVDYGWETVVWSPELGKFTAVARNSPFASLGNGITDSRRMVSSDGINWSLKGSIPPMFSPNSDQGWSYTSACWSPQHGIFAASAWSSAQIALGTTLPPTLDRRFMRWRSTAATDTWVTGSAAGFFNSGIVEAKIAKFAYYDRKLTQSELTDLGIVS